MSIPRRGRPRNAKKISSTNGSARKNSTTTPLPLRSHDRVRQSTGREDQPEHEREHERDGAGPQRCAESAQQDPLHSGTRERLPEDLAELAGLLEPPQDRDDERGEHDRADRRCR